MQEDFEYLYSLRKYILLVTGIFILSLIIGLLTSIKYPSLSENYLDMFKESFGWIKTLNPFVIMLAIFLNNAFKSLLTIFLGIGLGIVPLLFVAGNGIILGMFTYIVSRQQSTLFVLAATLPHGIIEIPMVLISAGIGLRLGHGIYLSMEGMKTDIKKELKQGFVFYIKWIAPLLFIAALVETFMTPLVASYFINPSQLP